MGVLLAVWQGRQGGQVADTLSASPEPPVGDMVAAPVAAEDGPDGWRPPLLP